MLSATSPVENPWTTCGLAAVKLVYYFGALCITLTAQSTRRVKLFYSPQLLHRFPQFLSTAKSALYQSYQLVFHTFHRTYYYDYYLFNKGGLE